MATGHVLIVDDSASIRFLLARTFELMGFRVSLAGDAIEADAVVAADPPDSVLLDQLLPDLLGTDLVASWRSRGISTPVIMMSSLTSDETRSLAAKLGVDYVAKPFSPIRLVDRVRSHLEPSALSA
jgi:DNA-binding response OmpR family regulator